MNLETTAATERREVAMAGDLLSRMMTYVDLTIDLGRQAGLPPERIVEAVSNRLGRVPGRGFLSADAGGEAVSFTSDEREQIRRAGIDPDELAFTSQATDFGDYKRRKAAFRAQRGGGA